MRARFRSFLPNGTKVEPSPVNDKHGHQRFSVKIDYCSRGNFGCATWFPRWGKMLIAFPPHVVPDIPEKPKKSRYFEILTQNTSPLSLRT